jgi:hypothetical protein
MSHPHPHRGSRADPHRGSHADGPVATAAGTLFHEAFIAAVQESNAAIDAILRALPVDWAQDECAAAAATDSSDIARIEARVAALCKQAHVTATNAYHIAFQFAMSCDVCDFPSAYLTAAHDADRRRAREAALFKVATLAFYIAGSGLLSERLARRSHDRDIGTVLELISTLGVYLHGLTSKHTLRDIANGPATATSIRAARLLQFVDDGVLPEPIPESSACNHSGARARARSFTAGVPHRHPYATRGAHDSPDDAELRQHRLEARERERNCNVAGRTVRLMEIGQRRFSDRAGGTVPSAANQLCDGSNALECELFGGDRVPTNTFSATTHTPSSDHFAVAHTAARAAHRASAHAAPVYPPYGHW